AQNTPPSRMAQVAKVAGLSLAVITLCGAVFAATMITRGRDTGGVTTDQTIRAGEQITGERALLPHELSPAVESGAADWTPPTPRPDGATSEQPRTTMASVDNSTGPAAADERTPSTTSQPPMSNRELVVEYYRLINSDPSDAFDLLAGEVFGTTLGEFQRSWTTVAQVEVLDVVDQSDGVLATGRMHLIDGATVLFQQLLTVSGTTLPRIVGAQLMSVQLN
nr:hypothetical protein [Actinomycetota bacterium]